MMFRLSGPLYLTFVENRRPGRQALVAEDFMCGDWIDRTWHASLGIEKSVVTGRQAASAIAADFGMECDIP
jgi:hypothetical protein